MTSPGPWPATKNTLRFPAGALFAAIVGAAFGVFLLASYSIPGDITIRIAFTVAVAVTVGLNAVLLTQKNPSVSHSFVAAAFFIGLFIFVSLPATLVSVEPVRHMEYLIMGVVGLILGVSLGYWFCVIGESKKVVFYIATLIAFLLVNLFFIFGQTPGSDEFRGVFRDRNYFAVYSMFLLWLSHYVRLARWQGIGVRAILIAFVILSASLGGLLMIMIYMSWLLWGKMSALCRRNAPRCIALIMVGSVSISWGAWLSPASERANPIIAFLVAGELPEKGSFARRMHQASEGLRLAKENPLLGLGYGSPQYAAETMGHYGQYSLHNTYLELWAGAGLPALVLIVGGLFIAVVVVVRGPSSMRGISLVGIASISLFFMTYSANHRIGAMAVFAFILMVALAYATPARRRAITART